MTPSCNLFLGFILCRRKVALDRILLRKAAFRIYLMPLDGKQVSSRKGLEVACINNF